MAAEKQPGDAAGGELGLGLTLPKYAGPCLGRPDLVDARGVPEVPGAGKDGHARHRGDVCGPEAPARQDLGDQQQRHAQAAAAAAHLERLERSCQLEHLAIAG